MRGFKRLFIKRCIMGCIIFVSFAGCAAVTGHQDGIAAYSKKFADGVCDVTEQKIRSQKATMPYFRQIKQARCLDSAETLTLAFIILT